MESEKRNRAEVRRTDSIVAARWSGGLPLLGHCSLLFGGTRACSTSLDKSRSAVQFRTGAFATRGLSSPLSLSLSLSLCPRWNRRWAEPLINLQGTPGSSYARNVFPTIARRSILTNRTLGKNVCAGKVVFLPEFRDTSRQLGRKYGGLIRLADAAAEKLIIYCKITGTKAQTVRTNTNQNCMQFWWTFLQIKLMLRQILNSNENNTISLVRHRRRKRK